MAYIFYVMKRIAIPVINGKLSEYFGRCTHYEIFEVNRRQVKRNLIEFPSDRDIKTMPLWISNQGITDVVTHKIDSAIMELFFSLKISLYVGIRCTSTEEIIQQLLEGKLKSDENIIRDLKNNRSLDIRH